MRKVKTECERDERSFISVEATVRRDWASESRERTWVGEVRGRTVASVTRVVCVLGSCLISCFLLSSACLPRRSLIVSLYYRTQVVRDGRSPGSNYGGLTISRNCPSIVYSQPFDLSSSVTRKTCSTARGIIPEVDSVCETHGQWWTLGGVRKKDRLTGPPSMVNDFPEPV